MAPSSSHAQVDAAPADPEPADKADAAPVDKAVADRVDKVAADRAALPAVSKPDPSLNRP
jgi:hypothetical protein